MILKSEKPVLGTEISFYLRFDELRRLSPTAARVLEQLEQELRHQTGSAEAGT